MPFPALEEVKQKRAAKQAELRKIFDEAGPNMDFAAVKSLPAGVAKGDTHALRDHVISLNNEMTDLGVEFDKLSQVEAAAIKAAGGTGRPGGSEHGDGAKGGRRAGGGDGDEQVDVGELFVKSAAYTGRSGRNGPVATLEVAGLKTLMQTTAGWAPEVVREGRVVPFATRPLQVAQMLPQNTTTQNAIEYMEETTFTNNAAEIAEAGTYPEAALVLTERSSPVRKIAVFLPVTDEQLDDEAQARGYINNRLPFMVRQRLDAQILVGNGTPPNLEGLLNRSGIQTQAKGADPVPDAIYKAIVKIRVTGQAEPNLVVLHPNDWMDVRLLRTADGLYIWGNPSDAGPERIWGMNVSQAQAETENTGLVADTSFLELTTRRGMDVQISNSHSGFFIEGKQAVRADIRVALVVYRPAAICTVTGI